MGSSRNVLMLTLVTLLVSVTVEAGPAPAGLASEIRRSSGVTGGVCVHAGATDGRLTAELGADGKFLVHGLALEASTVSAARAHVRSRGLYGRVSISSGAVTQLPYADDLVNLLVVDDLPKLMAKGLTMREVRRVLVPGGVAYVGATDPAKLSAVALRAWVAAGDVAAPEIVTRMGVWAKVMKPRPAAMDDWTHWRHDLDGNMVSRDTLVGIPRRLQWAVDPTWARSHIVQSGPRAMVTTGGRLFCVYDAAPRGIAGPMRLKLTARDAFNGVLLWERAVASDRDFDYVKTEGKYSSYYWYQRRSLVATGGRVYTVLRQQGPLVALDAATGKVLKTYDKVGSPREVLYHDGSLFLAIRPPASGVWGPRIICRVDAKTGEERWRKDKDRAYYILLADGSLFYDVGKSIVRVNADTGEEQWRAAKPEGAKILCFHQDGRLFLKGQAKDLTALSAEDGKHLWTYRYRDFNGFWYSDTDVYYVDGLVWVQTGGKRWAMVGINPATGVEARRIDFPESYPKTRGHHRCHPNKATSKYFVLDSAGIDFIDLQTGKVTDVRTIRGSCYYGVLPANGLLYVPPNVCQCGEYLRGFIAFASNVGVPALPPAERLVRGVAYGTKRGPGKPDTPADWPTYRHNPSRSGFTPASVPSDLKPLWQRDLGVTITAPTVAGGTVFVAMPETHEVCALDADSGKPLWRHTAEGRVDSPPTVSGPFVLFGDRTGWVTCLRARDGKLVWRYLAAPADRRVSAFGQLESTWPVNGSVLVKAGKAFFAAGRFSELDGGITVTAADVATGKVAWQTQTTDCLTDILAGKVYEKSYPPVAINDVLTASGNVVSMNTWGFDVKTGRTVPRRYEMWPRSGMLDGASWAGRMRWRGPRLHAELLVFDRKRTCGFTIRTGTEWPAIPGKGGYVLFSRRSWKDDAWSRPIPLRAQAMVLADKTLFLAGAPDVVEKGDYWNRVEGRKGCELWAVSAADGKKLSAIPLDAPPVFDGLAAANGRLYLSTRDGKLRCFAGK